MSSSYANVTGNPSRIKVNFNTLFTPAGNGIDVVIPVKSNRVISERFANTAYSFFFGNPVAYHVVANYVKLYGVPVTVFTEDDFSAIATKFGTPLMLDSYTSDTCMQSWDRSSYARAMIKLRADVELKDNIVVFGNVQEECPKNIGEMKNLKKPSQTPKGIKVGQKVGFNLTKHVFQLVSKKPTANSENKKKNVKPNKEVSMSNSFNVLTLVVNDEEFGTNEETLNFASQEANSRGSTVEKLIIDEKVTLLVDEGKPLKKVVFSSDYDSDDEVASIDNEMANFFAKKDGNGTQSFLKQWKESYENDDYEYDPYDDNMYEGQEIPDKIQAIYDNLDIKVMGHKKK
nr:hypothetical protein [Tanacetum cinerariifolium]